MISLPIFVVLFAIGAGFSLCRELYKAAGELIKCASMAWIVPAFLFVVAGFINLFMIVKVFLYFFTPNF